jgi:hypothetical protein
LNPHVLADTRPSTSQRRFQRLFFNSIQWSDLHKCRLGATRCNVRQTSGRTIGIKFRIMRQRFTTNYLVFCREFPRLFSWQPACEIGHDGIDRLSALRWHDVRVRLRSLLEGNAASGARRSSPRRFSSSNTCSACASAESPRAAASPMTRATTVMISPLRHAASLPQLIMVGVAGRQAHHTATERRL